MHFGQVSYINFREALETKASLLFEKREQDRANANKAFSFLLKKGQRWNFLHIWNPESQAGTKEKKEQENQRERDRAAVLHVTGGELEPAPWRASQMQIGSHKFPLNWLNEMWDSVMLMCLSNAQWPSGHSPLIGPLCENIKQSGVSAKCIIMALIYFPGIEIWDSIMLIYLSNVWWPSKHYPGIGPYVRFKQSAVSAKCTYL